jgi:hypothetical protein
MKREILNDTEEAEVCGTKTGKRHVCFIMHLTVFLYIPFHFPFSSTLTFNSGTFGISTVVDVEQGHGAWLVHVHSIHEAIDALHGGVRSRTRECLSEDL